MDTKFYCNSEDCTHADNGPFVLELPQESVMDGNNLATIFCPLCSKPMRPLPSDLQEESSNQRFYCHNEACSNSDSTLFFIDLPAEAIMDNNNLATVFCPKCSKEMRPLTNNTAAVING